MGHDFLGYLIVAGADVLLAVLLLILVARRKVPLLTNLFVRSIVSIFKISEDEDQ